MAAAFQVLSEDDWIISAISETGIRAMRTTESGISEGCDLVMSDGALSCFSTSLDDEQARLLVQKVLDKFRTSDFNLLQQAFIKFVQHISDHPEFKNPYTFVLFKTHRVTTTLILINTLVFILMLIKGVHFFDPDTEDIIHWGGNWGPLVLGEHQYWRLITSVFVHIGILHIAMNMYALYFIGLLLEEFVGSKWFLASYLICGIGASAASSFMHSDLVSAGASGAIFGMFGLFLSLLLIKAVDKSVSQTMLKTIAIYIGYSLLMGLRGGVDNAAHVGGLICGILLGLSWKSLNPLVLDIRKFLPRFAGVSLFILLLSGFLIESAPQANSVWINTYEKFSELEMEAMHLYDYPKETDGSVYVQFIQDTGLPDWRLAQKLLLETDTIELNNDQLLVRRQLLRYTDLRIESYEKMILAFIEDSDDKWAEVENINLRIEEKLKEINQ